MSDNENDSLEALNEKLVEGESKKNGFFDEFKSIIIIIVSVLAFRSVFYEPFKIPSGSMIPTLLIGDFILVDKFAYGFKVPFSDWFTNPIYITGPDKPKRGDIIVFKYPKDESLNYIKRVIGLPGDTIEVIEKVVYVNDQPINAQEFDGKEIMEDMDDKFKRYKFKFYKTKTGEHEHVYQVDTENMWYPSYSKTEVPKGHYFVMGDNRDFSQDSRYWGFVPFENIKGEAIMIWFSWSFPWFWEKTEETFKFRPWRIGTILE